MHERTSWLLRSDRACLPVLCEALQQVRPVISDEVGEEFRLYTLARATTVEPLLDTSLVRFAMPVTETLPTSALAENLPEAFETLKRCAAASGATQGYVFLLRRHGRFAAANVAAWLKTCFGDVQTNDMPALFIAIGDTRTYVGTSTMLQTGATVAGGWPTTSIEASGLPSRAGGKLEESLAWLDTHGLQVPPSSTWLELGAFPGGMTTALTRRGFRVVAVDVNPSNETISQLPGVTYHSADAETFDAPRPVDAILCDMNGPPEKAAATVARLSAALRPGGFVIHTIKLPDWNDLARMKQLVRSAFGQVGIDQITVKHLAHNRQEVTFIGRKTTDREVSPWRPM